MTHQPSPVDLDPGEKKPGKKAYVSRHMDLTDLSKRPKILRGVKYGKTFSKWGNLDEKLLNGVISVQNGKLGGKKQNSLLLFRTKLRNISLGRPLMKGRCLEVTDYTCRFIKNTIE
jgi:hypothetical protein